MKANEIGLNQVDELGMLLAQIADLTAKADAIKDGIKDAATNGGDKVYEGAMFKSTFIESNRSTVDYKKLCADIGVTAEQLAAYTKTTAVFSVKTTTR
jgi:hypothetical protein